MNKRILLGVDADLSFNTQYALRTTGEFMMQIAPQVDIALLHVIPTVQTTGTHAGFYTGQISSTVENATLRRKATEALQKARLLLQEQGVLPDRCECIIRTGGPVEEIVKAAFDLQVAMIIVGSRGNSAKEQIRRFFVGSISRRVLKHAPCPVIIMASPNPAQMLNLVNWYSEAITLYLRTHSQTLSVFTPQEVAQQFAPVKKSSPGRKEIHAAAEALEQLAKKGMLFRHSVKGELRYVND
jgi:nucleotide-binding universal stress UspA family protein